MSRIAALLKLLCVPVLIALLYTAAQSMLMMQREGMPWEGGVELVARNSFVLRAAFSLVLTVVIGLPFLRYCIRRGRDGFVAWTETWLLVHALQLLSGVGVALLDMASWWDFISQLACILVVSSLWWWLFYAGEAKEAR